MNVEDFRKYCLSLNGVTEKMPFGKATSQYDRNLLVFSIGDKWFCLVNIEIFDFCVLKSEPDLIEELRIQYDSIRPGYHMNHKHWISVYFNTDVPDNKIKELVQKSHNLIIDGLSKKQKESLN
ncbi:MmcQ/YjbR family DNA-binding protein [Flavobacterium sp. HJJ]|uniref:MmcQ/YjbR family DNA-binding protein n=1 Tax=Flavobacterium sp. HJJ TaxID=2783792 RepID=UPI00188AD147|nr:MmcQ/YjbR family DNA-binding protein [Flavobacterium sp. HJJ]MBF4470597.1 MmcQ/YjbR family DNA-binding protein [Flavobacterium sp. HJJ]